MPTTHVESTSEALLQDIANALYKARKVVVITGAGISTNSGIPDFRSENGLYSLIQAQFDAAAEAKQDASQEPETSDRPPKRPRLDPREANDDVGDTIQVATTTTPENDDSQLADTSAEHEGKDNNSAQVTTPPSKVTGNNGEPSDRPPQFPSSPLTLDFSHLRHDRGLCSSPLSSPPPVLLDPYRDSSTSRSSRSDSVSSDSDSQDPSSVSTPLLTSQSSKNTLPNMKGKDLFDAQIWSCPVKTSVFYTFATTLRQKVRAAEPTTSHHFVSVLRDSRKLVRCYTQNIDQLEERVGLATSLQLGAGSRYRFSTRKPAGGRPKDADQGGSQEEDRPSSSQGQKENDCPPASQPPASQPPAASQPDALYQDTCSQPAAPNRGVECVFLHGSLAELRCFVCARTASWDEAERQADTLAGRQPECPHCAGATAAREERGKRALGVGKLRPDIVLYGEEHPHAHLISPLVQHDLSLGPDMLLILGTSMRVHGLKVLVKEFAKAVHDKGGKVVFVNFTKPPESVWSDVLDFWVQWDCDAWVGDLQNRKPALWLPPGTVLPEEDKAKASKAARRISGGGGETGKKKADKAVDKTTDNSDKAAEKDKAEEPKQADKTDKPPTSNRRRRESDNKGLKALVEAASTVQDQLAIEALSALKKHRVTPEEMSYHQELVETAETTEMLPPPLPVLKALARRPTKPPREPKLNPGAKRPASVRDHKNNAAHLVWRIMGSLEVIRNLHSEEEKQVPVPVRVAVPVETTVKDKSRNKGRSLDEKDKPKMTGRKKPQPKEDSQPSIEVSANDAGGGNPPDQGDGTQGDVEADSITAAVKTRKRKRNVTWKMIRGVETRVSLDKDGTEIALPPPHHPHATAVPVNMPIKAPQRPRSKTPQPPAPQQTQILAPATIPKNRALPKPKPQAPRNRTNSGASIPPHTAIHTTAIFTPKPLANLAVEVVDKYDAGFQETDRLIARYHELASGTQSVASTRASSPQPSQNEAVNDHQLPPLNMRNLNNAQTTVPRRGSTTSKGSRKRAKTGPANGLLKLQVLEPKFDTPGPLSENVLSPNVGSPPIGFNGPRGRMGSVHQQQGHNDQENQPPGQEQQAQQPADRCQHQQQQVSTQGQPQYTGRNPFFYSDPLASHLSFPPRWGDQQQQPPQSQSQYQQAVPLPPADYPIRYWSTTALDMFFRPCMEAQKRPSQDQEQDPEPEQTQQQSMGLGIQEPSPISVSAHAPEAEALEPEVDDDDPWIEAARRVRQRLPVPMGGDLSAAALAQLAVQGAAVQPTLPFSTILPARGVPARFYTPFQAWQQQRLEEIRLQGPPTEQEGQQQAVGMGSGTLGQTTTEGQGSGPGAGQGQGQGQAQGQAPGCWPPPGWSAEEQLRQEAAMMLSSMRGSA
ncbi:hypothetical protein QBC45DRAFT_410535 [Copromyces sp. CBS 386.78]|nr:hypothetical protein QBC45DRAFT_410535 [Copromyces sp. CBS 386.78]